LKEGWIISRGDATIIEVWNAGGATIQFDIIVNALKGAVFACRFVRDTELAMARTEPGRRMDVTKAHSLLSDGDKESMRQMAKELGWKISRWKMKHCVHCACAKAKQKKTVKESKAKKRQERLMRGLSLMTRW
jgi:hypothetical protein